MLNLIDIQQFYSHNEQQQGRSILREYLQYKILQIIFESEIADKLSFMGGTCLRIILGTQRFSEDLGFDNFGLTVEDFNKLAVIITEQMQGFGYEVEVKTVHHNAFRCYIRLPKILFENKLSGYREEKILIQVDSEAQKFEYTPEVSFLNKFDVFTKVAYTPKDILLSQKIWAILNRKTPKGRDYYDTLFLFGITTPNFEYLKLKAGIENLQQLKETLYNKTVHQPLSEYANDVNPFLLNPAESKRIEMFPEFIKGLRE